MANCRVLVVLLLCGMFMGCLTTKLEEEVELTWGGERAKIVEGGNVLSLTLDKASGSGFQSKKEYLFARIDMEIKLVSGNSAGTVTAFYLSSQGAYHDEIDFEFLGNVSGDPYTLHTNVFTKGTGNREQQFHLWFDPTKSFHQYSILWNPQRIIFLVDNMAIRVFENLESNGIPFPTKQKMRLHSSLWNADQWATRGGLVKTDWSKGPFTAYYRNFKASTCTNCGGNSVNNKKNSWENQKVDAYGRRRLRWVQKYHMIYNYCSDYKRFPHGRPRECRRASRFF